MSKRVENKFRNHLERKLPSASSDYLVSPGEIARLVDYEPGSKYDPLDHSLVCPDYSKLSEKEREILKGVLGEDIAGTNERIRKRLGDFYADGGKAVLIILQGLDASGKDSAERSGLFGFWGFGMRPYSFGAPTAEEKKHHYLWRVEKQLPGKGQIAVWSRSQYEDYLVPGVRGWISPEEASARLPEMADFERRVAAGEPNLHYLENGEDGGAPTEIIKFFLNVSEREQAERFEQRLTDPRKHYKADSSDFEDLKRREHFLRAYERALPATTSESAPWYVIPCDDKPYSRALMSQIVLDHLDRMDLSPRPLKPDVAARRAEYLAELERIQAKG